MLQQTHYTLDNGIGSFQESSPDYELAPVGLGSFHGQAQKLADFGRNGDIYVVHAAEGETVVPMEVLDANPKVKELLFGQMREMGLDPQEFVVGDTLNSINPVTGFPEFFFKSIFRSVKKAVKKVFKVIKKAAPIILPIAAAMFGVPFLGPAFGAGTFGASFLGSGIGTLVGGGSLGDALKAGLMSGGTTLLMSGASAAFRGANIGDALSGTFTGGTTVPGGTQYAASWGANNPLTSAVYGADVAAASGSAGDALFSSVGGGDLQSVAKGALGFGDVGANTPGFVPNTAGVVPATTATQAIAPAEVDPSATFVEGTSAGSLDSNAPFVNIPQSVPGSASVAPVARVPLAAGYTGQSYVPQTGLNLENVPATPVTVTPDPVKPWYTELSDTAGKAYDTAADVLFPPDPTPEAIGVKAAELMQNNPTVYGGEEGRKLAFAAAKENLSPGIIKQYGPSLALAGGAAGLLGAFDITEEPNPPQEDLLGAVPKETGETRFQSDPNQYLVANLVDQPVNPASPQVGTAYDLVPTTGSLLTGAHGGMVEFPRRKMLVEGPGTETSDDIPAMLSDGEFVINSRAVKGADPTGQGNRYAGAQNLYNMMRNFEMRA